MKKLIILLFIVLIIFFIPTKTQFTITDGNTGKLVYYDDLEEFEDFNIRFIHSVNRTPVNEYYKIDNNKFILYKTCFYSYGAGMSDGSDIPNSSIHYNDDGLIEIESLNKEFEKVTYYVGTFANHTLLAGNKEFMLKDLIEPKCPAVFEIKKVSIYTMIRGFL